jgi:hypothetical protein
MAWVVACSSSDDAATSSTGGAAECISNSDCTAPANVCDTIKGTCVECLVTADCSDRPGTVCSAGACVCKNEALDL